MSTFITYLKNVRAELSHVVWPTKRQSLTHVALIILIGAITAVYTGLLDHLFTRLVGLFIA
jgi:preprotein translocase SecE subunit